MIETSLTAFGTRILRRASAVASAWQQRPVARQYPELLELVRWFNGERSKPMALYLGDSVSERVSRHDQDTRDLKTMVADQLRPSTTATVSYSGYQSQVFYHLVRVLERTKQKPALVILPVNLRSFSPQWYLNPELQFKQEIAVIEAFLANPQRSIGRVQRTKDGKHIPLPPSRLEFYKSSCVKYPLTSFKRIGEFVELINSRPSSSELDLARFRKKQIFIFHYLYPLQADHMMLSYLRKIVSQVARMNMSLLMYVTPINYQAGERLVGPEFLGILKTSAQVIRNEVLPQDGDVIKLVDWSTLLSCDGFFGDEEATEHLNENGRRVLARHIAHEVRQMSIGQNQPHAQLEMSQ